jgi:hypothetical protein
MDDVDQHIRVYIIELLTMIFVIVAFYSYHDTYGMFTERALVLAGMVGILMFFTSSILFPTHCLACRCGRCRGD